MKKISLLLAVILWASVSYAQNYTTPFFQPGDEIRVEVQSDGNFYLHKFAKGNTLYSLSKMFRVPLDEILIHNDISDVADIDLNKIIRLPISNKNIVQTKGDNGPYIPVVYIVEPKETLYTICKKYFNQDISNIMNRNGMNSNTLDKGQKLTIGWLPIGAKPITKPSQEVSTELIQSFRKEDVAISDEHNDNKIYRSSADSHFVYKDSLTHIDTLTNAEKLLEKAKESGFNISLLGDVPYRKTMKTEKARPAAYWDKSIPDNGTVFALHQTAVLNTYIHIYNPLVKRSVKAKVIGRIPYGTYTNDVKLVLSPRAANLLGGRDRRFKVEVEAIVIK